MLKLLELQLSNYGEFPLAVESKSTLFYVRVSSNFKIDFELLQVHSLNACHTRRADIYVTSHQVQGFGAWAPGINWCDLFLNLHIHL